MIPTELGLFNLLIGFHGRFYGRLLLWRTRQKSTFGLHPKWLAPRPPRPTTKLTVANKVGVGKLYFYRVQPPPRPCTARATGALCNFRRAQNGRFGGAIRPLFALHAGFRATPAVQAKGRVRTAKLVRVERCGRRARLVLRPARVGEKVGIWALFWADLGPYRADRAPGGARRPTG